MILRFETSKRIMDDEFFTSDPEETIYEKDEIFLSDEESDDEEEELGEDYSDGLSLSIEENNQRKPTEISDPRS